MLRSEEVRKLAPEMDPLRMGMGWKVSDLSKPQIMVESSYGDSHPGSAHLNIFVEEAVKAVDEMAARQPDILLLICVTVSPRDTMGSITPWHTAMPLRIWWRHRPMPQYSMEAYS